MPEEQPPVEEQPPAGQQQPPAEQQPFDVNQLFNQYGGQHSPQEYVAAVEAAGYEPQLVSGKVPTNQYGDQVLADVKDESAPGVGRIRTGELEQKSYAERSALPATGTASKSYSYWDDGRGVQVHAPAGSHFELYPGGGVRIVKGLIPKGTPSGAPASSLFTQGTQGVPGGAEGQTQATPGFKEEKLGYAPIEGKTIARTGQTVFNPTTGVDEHAGEGEVLIEYTDGTVERRKLGAAPGTAVPIGQFGRTAEELGITRGTEIKAADGSIARAPQSIDQLALTDPEAADKAIVAKGLASTRDLTFLGTTRDGKTAREGNAFYQAADGTVLERPLALRGLAKQPQQAGGGANLEQMLRNAGLDVNMNALGQSFQQSPGQSVESMYRSLLEKSGAMSAKAELERVLKEKRDLEQKFIDEVAEINSNPWLSEGVRVLRIRKLEEKYEAKRAVLAANQVLFQGLYDTARQEAQFITSTAISQFNADRTFDLQKQQFAFQKAEAMLDAQFKLQQLEADRAKTAKSSALDERKLAEQIRQFDAEFSLKQATEARLGRSGSGGSTSSREQAAAVDIFSSIIDDAVRQGATPEQALAVAVGVAEQQGLKLNAQTQQQLIQRARTGSAAPTSTTSNTSSGLNAGAAISTVGSFFKRLWADPAGTLLPFGPK